MSKLKTELRYSEAELADFQDQGEGVVTGYPVVFGKPANIGGMFTEFIEPGALDECDLRDVQFLVNHNGQGITLARSRNNNKNSTMQLERDQKGLKMTAHLDVENNSEARALYSAIKRGDITGMSFRFLVDKDEWEDLKTKNPKRHILKISHIREISAVNSPAYGATSITARSLDSEGVLENARAALENVSVSALELAKAKNENYFI